MTFDDWMLTVNPLHQPSDGGMETRLLRKCWEAANESATIALRECAAMAAARERDRCATRAWVHYMDVCKARRLPPSEHEHWNAARAVRSQAIDDDPMPCGHADISDDDPGPNVEALRQAR